MHNFIPFITYLVLTEFTPGPNTIIAMSSASRFGLKKSIPLLIGIFSGFLIVMLLCCTFSVVLRKAVPEIIPVMAKLGSLYILWLAWGIFRRKPDAHQGYFNKPNEFMTGFALQFVNVKIMLYGITAISGFVAPHYDSPFALLAFTLILCAVGWTAVTAWAIFGAAFHKIFVRYNSVLNAAMALMLVGCAALIF